MSKFRLGDKVDVSVKDNSTNKYQVFPGTVTAKIPTYYPHIWMVRYNYNQTIHCDDNGYTQEDKRVYTEEETSYLMEGTYND